MLKLTKIVATIGPATDTEEKIRNLITLGVNVFRFNLKHNLIEWHEEKIRLVKQVAEDLDLPVATLIDLQGPEIRASFFLRPQDSKTDDNFPGDVLDIELGEEILLGEDVEGEKGITLSHQDVIKHLKIGDKILIDDGKFEFEVKDNKKKNLVIVSNSKGRLGNNKSVSIPGTFFPLPLLTKKDKDALVMAAKNRVDFVALSFVRTAEDVTDLRKKMKELELKAKIVSKIETKLAVDNLDDVISVSDAVMVARGDLGVELPMEEVPFQQKRMIKKCIEQGVPVITATHMLASMVTNPKATRAEISDVANAVYDFTDAVMLSEETAAGQYPERAVDTMRKTVEFIEEQNIEDTRALFNHEICDQEEMLCDAAYNLYLQLLSQGSNLGGFIVFSQTGRTARKLSRYRAKVPIFVFAPNLATRDYLNLSFGVFPILQEKIFRKNQQIRAEHMQEALVYLKEKKFFSPEKYYILLYGDMWRVEGKLSTIKVIYPEKKG